MKEKNTAKDSIKNISKQLNDQIQSSKETILNVILDESSSMASFQDATLSGFNEYVDGLRNKENVFLTLTLFNTNRVKVVCDAIPIKDVKILDTQSYQPAASTPLYDAIGESIQSIEKSMNGKRSAVLCLIMTDGEENSSHQYTKEAIAKLIKEKESQGWTFVYLGANQDAWAVCHGLGFAAGNTRDYTPETTGGSFVGLAAATGAYLAAGSVRSCNVLKTYDAVVEKWDDQKEKALDKKWKIKMGSMVAMDETGKIYPIA